MEALVALVAPVPAMEALVVLAEPEWVLRRQELS
jgi:hypothetical protein